MNEHVLRRRSSNEFSSTTLAAGAVLPAPIDAHDGTPALSEPWRRPSALQAAV